MSSRMHNITNRTHVEDVKHPEKVLLPRGNPILVSLRENKSGERISFALLHYPPLNLGYGSAVETSARNARCQSGSRSQTPNCFEDGLVEVIQIFPLQSSVERLAYSTTIPPEINVILVVHHCVLGRVNQKYGFAEWGERTRIIVRRILAAPKATWAGGTPQVSLARFNAWMNTSNAERTPSRLFGCWDEAIVETCDGREEEPESEPRMGGDFCLVQWFGRR